MYCLHCGDCCKRMSPISSPDPCPHIVEVDGLVFCGIYNKRPQQCRDHDFPASKCPQGCMTLDIQNPQQAYDRINHGYAIILAGLEHVDVWGI